jgi:hypothetical protein
MEGRQMKDEALKLALEALENSVDLVREDAYNAEKLYGNYPSRQGKVAGLKVLADDHEKAITAIKQALAAPVQEPMHPEIKKMYEDYFDKWFRESSAAVPENFMDALMFDTAVRDVDAMIALARADERESCAKVCDRMAARCNDIRAAALDSAAENIRARGQK